jgi:uncharacterized membrane protein YbhN (UPF0104 family)
VKPRTKLALRLLVIAVVAASLWFFVRHMEWAKLEEALRGATWWPLAISAVLAFTCLFLKSVCWRVMLAPNYRVPVMRLFRYTIAAFAGSALAPARAGEVLRIWVLKRRDGVPAADTAAVAVAEKLLDGMSMLLLVSPVPWLLPELPSWVSTALLTCAVIAVVAFGVLFVLVGRVAEKPGTSWFARFLAGMHVVRSPRRMVLSMLALMGVWIADLGEVMLCLYAVGIHLPIAAGLVILFALNLTIMVPSTPAQVGALEVGALAALDLLHVPSEQAITFALLYHAVQVIPLIIIGLALEHRLVLGRERMDAPAPAPG